MRRTLELTLAVGDIFLWLPVVSDTITWTAGPENPLKFTFAEQGLDGVIWMNLDVRLPSEYTQEVDESARRLKDYPMSCSRVKVTVDAECDGGSTQKRFLETAQRVTDTYVNRLLSYVRTELAQHWVVPVPIGEWELGYFFFQGRAVLLEDGQVTEILGGDPARYMIAPPLGFDGPMVPLYDSRRDELCRFVKEGIGPTAETELIASAKQHFVNSEYGVAAVEAVSSLEVGLGTFVGYRLRRKRSYKRYKDVRERIGAMTYLKALLPLAATEEELDSCRPLIGDCAELVAVRNRVAHAGARPSEDEVEKIRLGISAVEHMLDVVRPVGREPAEAVS